MPAVRETAGINRERTAGRRYEKPDFPLKALLPANPRKKTPQAVRRMGRSCRKRWEKGMIFIQNHAAVANSGGATSCPTAEYRPRSSDRE